MQIEHDVFENHVFLNKSWMILFQNSLSKIVKVESSEVQFQVRVIFFLCGHV